MGLKAMITTAQSTLCTAVTHISVNAAHEIGPLNHDWRFFGYDECNYTYTPEGRRMLERFGKLGDAPYYVRTHFLFCNGSCTGTQKFGSTNLYHEDAQGNPIYDFTYIDLILDTILESGNKPYVELGFMPEDLADPSFRNNPWLGGLDPYRESGWTYPPKDYHRWHGFIRTFTRHLAERYGSKEVDTWYFELWNEPDIFYWSGSDKDYCMLFDFTEQALHTVLPNARLGGPTCTGIFDQGGGRELMQTFLEHCKTGTNAATSATGTRLDFITFHVKGAEFPRNANATKAVPSVGNLVHQIESGVEMIEAAGFGGLEIVLSEADPDTWAAGGINDNANMRFRDTEYYASFVACAYQRIAEIAQRYGAPIHPLAWAFVFPQEECFPATRTFATQDIVKPVFRAFDMLSRLGSHALELSSDSTADSALEQQLDSDYGKAAPHHYTGLGAPTMVSGWAARNDAGQLQVLLYSHCDDIDVHEERSIELQITGLEPNQRYQLHHWRIDGTHSNAHTQWLAEGHPKYPAGEKYDRIKTADALELLTPEEIITATSAGTATLRFTMPTHAVSLLTFDLQ
ncbi:GH39 family glycosyl hydrolase [Bifidobacterium felsineum]|uniref:Glycosyl hydrolases family 39 N-terminal catalytic domain-containing protein n=1 Tax=Bifidobacterium felsineum TaxID=2045440 RepID=A0A2M9HJ45_9BIFI|nr:hypothetical protein [Bifidobacterium felsineum]PJM76832.1 hypothetical protein CSQ86_06935 [Bifidobacterium felsineum]